VWQSSAAFPKTKIKEKLIIDLKLKKIYYIDEIHLQQQRNICLLAYCPTSLLNLA